MDNYHHIYEDTYEDTYEETYEYTKNLLKLYYIKNVKATDNLDTFKLLLEYPMPILRPNPLYEK